MTPPPKYPHVHVQLTGEDSHPLLIIARVRKALTRAKVPAQEVEAFAAEARSGDYDHVLQTVMRTVETS